MECASVLDGQCTKAYMELRVREGREASGREVWGQGKGAHVKPSAKAAQIVWIWTHPSSSKASSGLVRSNKYQYHPRLKSLASGLLYHS
jgi:hypothetical protein